MVKVRIKSIPNTFSEGSGIHIDPNKKGTFKAEATRLGKSLSELSRDIDANPEKYSPAMRRKNAFFKGIVEKEDGGNLFVGGGPFEGLHTNGIDFTNQGDFTEFNTGSSHELNGNGGTPQGVDNEGTLNYVEEGETKYDNYIYSNRLTIPTKEELDKELKGLLENQGGASQRGWEIKVLKPYAGMTYADASKKVFKDIEERPNDPIAKRGFEALLAVLQNSQEKTRAIKNQLDLADEIKAMSDLEFNDMKELQEAELQMQLLAMEQAAQLLAMQELIQLMSPEEQAMLLQLMQLQVPLLLMAEGGNLFANGNYLWDPFYLDTVLAVKEFSPSTYKGNMYWNPNALNVLDLEQSDPYKAFTEYVKSHWNDEDVLKYILQINKLSRGRAITSPELFDVIRNDLKYGYWHLTPEFQNSTASPKEVVDGSSSSRINRYFIKQGDDYLEVQQAPTNYTFIKNRTEDPRYIDFLFDPKDTSTKEEKAIERQKRYFIKGDNGYSEIDVKDLDTDLYLSPRVDDTTDPNYIDYYYDPLQSNPYKRTLTIIDDTYKTPSDWPMWAGLGLQGAGLLYNVLTPVDYSNANAVINAAKTVGLFTPISPELIPYLLEKRRRFDSNYWVNRLTAENEARIRDVMNTSGGNRGTAMAGILAADYNYNQGLGEMGRLGLLFNAEQDIKEAKYLTEDVDARNQQAKMQAALANQEARARAASASMSGLAQGYGMREQAAANKAAAISAGLSGAMGTLGDLYKNRYTNYQVDWALNHGLYPGIKPAAKGGKIKTKKKKGITV